MLFSVILRFDSVVCVVLLLLELLSVSHSTGVLHVDQLSGITSWGILEPSADLFASARFPPLPSSSSFPSSSFPLSPSEDDDLSSSSSGLFSSCSFILDEQDAMSAFPQSTEKDGVGADVVRGRSAKFAWVGREGKGDGESQREMERGRKAGEGKKGEEGEERGGRGGKDGEGKERWTVMMGSRMRCEGGGAEGMKKDKENGGKGRNGREAAAMSGGGSADGRDANARMELERFVLVMRVVRGLRLLYRIKALRNLVRKKRKHNITKA